MDNKNVNHPEHYNFSSIETIDYIEAVLGKEGCYAFCIGNAIKYISRARHKGKVKEDLEKAIWYLQHAEELGMQPITTQTVADYKEEMEKKHSYVVIDECKGCPYKLEPGEEPHDEDYPCNYCSNNPSK